MSFFRIGKQPIIPTLAGPQLPSEASRLSESPGNRQMASVGAQYGTADRECRAGVNHPRAELIDFLDIMPRK